MFALDQVTRVSIKRRVKQDQQMINGKMMLNYLISIMSAMLVMNRHQIRSHLPGSIFVQRRPEAKTAHHYSRLLGSCLFCPSRFLSSLYFD